MLSVCAAVSNVVVQYLIELRRMEKREEGICVYLGAECTDCSVLVDGVGEYADKLWGVCSLEAGVGRQRSNRDVGGVGESARCLLRN